MTDLPEFTYRLVIVVSILLSTTLSFPLAKPQQAGEWTKEKGKESRLAVQEILGKSLAEVLNRHIVDAKETPLSALSNIQTVGQKENKSKKPKETGKDSVQEILQVPISASDMYRLNTGVVADISAPDRKPSKMPEVEKNTEKKPRDQGDTDTEETVSTPIKASCKINCEESENKAKEEEVIYSFAPKTNTVEEPEVTIEAMIEEAFAGAESQLEMSRLLEELMNKGLGQLLPNITGHLEKVGLDEHGSTVAVGVVEQEVWMTWDGARKPVKMRLQYALKFQNMSETVSLPLNHTETETNETDLEEIDQTYTSEEEDEEVNTDETVLEETDETNTSEEEEEETNTDEPVLEEIDETNVGEEEEEESETNSVDKQPTALIEYEWMGTTLVPSPPSPYPGLPAPALTPPYLTEPQLVYASPPYYLGLYNPYYYY